MSRFRPSRNYISGEVVFEGGPVDISGDLIVSGTITANEYQVNVINTNVTHIDADGNTKFGDTPDDTHQFTGSVFISGPLSASSIIGGGATTPGAPDTSVQYNDGGAFAGDPNFTWNDGTSTLAVTGDISGSGNISGSSFYGDGSNLTNLPSAAITTYDTPGDDRIVTSVNATTVQGEADLTFDGTTLTVTGDISGSGNISGSFFYGDGSNLTNLPAGSPAGINTQVQFNADGAFGADTGLTWASASNTLTVNGPLVITGSTSELQTPEIQFDIDHVAAGHSTGRIYWDDEDKTITADMQGSSVRLQIGQEQHIYVKNSSTGSIPNGAAVRIIGAAGTNVEVDLAIAMIRPFTEATEQDAILGLATEEILFNQSGYITTFGQVRDVDTSAFSTGDILYLSHTVSGSWTNTKPPAPYFDARIGIVEVVNATTGVILSRPAEPLFLADIASITASNVPVGVPSYLCYDDSTQIAIFTNELSGAFSGSFQGDGSGLTNLTPTSPAGSNTQIQYNADGALGADADFTWASGSNTLNVNGYISSSAIAISSSNPAETLLNVSGYNFPNLLNVDASSSLDGGARVMIRNSNDDIIDPNTSTIPRGVLHIEQDSTSSVAINSNGISVWTNADENYQSALRLHTWNPIPGNGSAIYLYTNEGTFPAGFVTSGQALGRINFGGQATSQTELGYFFQARASQTWNGSSINSSYLQFYSVPPGLGAGLNIKERIRFTGEGHIIIFPYEASNADAEALANNFNDGIDTPALQVYGPTLFGSSSANTHIFTGSVIFEGDLSASLNVSASAFYGDGSNLTNLPSAAITTYNSASAGRIITSVDATTVEGEENLTFDNTTLAITGDVSGSGNISGSAFYGDGANLADLNASNVSAGTLDNARLPSTISVTNVTASSLVSASFFYGDGSNLTNLPAGSPAGSNTQIQYNADGAFGSDADFTWASGSNTLTVTGDISASVNISGSDFYGGGANLTDLNASNISAGTLDNARLPATISVTNITASALVSASFLYGDGSNLTNLPAGSPGGSDTQIQFNDGGVFNGDAEFTWNKTTDTLTVTGDISGSGNISGSFFYGDGSNLTNVNASLLVGKSLFVDSVNGDDGTGTRGNESLPYLTVGAAITDSLSGDAIYVGPGDYPESGLSLPTGRALIGAAGYTRTSLGITSSATDILATVDDTWVEGLTFNVPTGSGNAGIRYTGTGGTMQAYSLAYVGDGASGLGDGFVKTGTGKVIGAEVRLTTGGLNSIIRSDQGVMAFESIHVPNTSGVVENVALVEGTSRAQLINFNAGNPNVVNTLTVTGSATAICLSVNWFNVQNGINLLQDGISVEINGGLIEPSTYTVKMDFGVTWTSATNIDIVNAQILPTYFFPPSGLDTEFEAFYTQKKGDNYLGAARLLGVDFTAGFPEKGAGIQVGKGASYGLNTKVYTSDGTDTSTTVGNVTDVSTTASSLADSTFTFEGGAVDHCIYYGSIRKTSDGELVKNFGTLIDTTVGSLTGAYAFEIWNGTAWTDIDYMCTSLGEGYRYANNPFMRSSSKEFTRLGTTPSTTWATSSVDGIDAYWSRCRITTSASLPTFERWWLTPSHFMVSSEGVRQSHGAAAWKQTLVGAGNIFGETGGVVTADISVGSGVSPNAWTHNMPNSLLNQNGDAIYTQFALPSGINTSFPLTFKVLYSLDNNTGVTTFPTGILSAIPLEVTGIEVVDPTGGKIPTARQFDSTETLTSKAAPLALSLSMQPAGAVATDDLSDRIFSIEYESLSIEEYYEDDVIAIRFELSDDGTPNYNVAIWAIIVEGHKFTEGKAI